MTKEEQIEEITKLINSKEKYPCEDDVHCENCFCANKDTAEKLYDAGYHKIDEFEKRLCDKYVEIDNLNRDYSNAFERLKSQQQEIGALKAKNEQLKAKLEKIPLAIKQKMMEEYDYELTEREQEIKRLNSHNGFLQSVISHNKDMLDEAVKQAKIDVLNELIDGYGRDYISPVGLEKYKVVRVLKEIIEEIQNAEDKS